MKTLCFPTSEFSIIKLRKHLQTCNCKPIWYAWIDEIQEICHFKCADKTHRVLQELTFILLPQLHWFNSGNHTRRSSQSVLQEINPEYWNDAEGEIPIFWPPDTKSWLTGKDHDARKDWGQEEKRARGWDGWTAWLTQAWVSLLLHFKNNVGRRIWRRMDTYICLVESLCCPPEIMTTLLISLMK